MSFEYLLWLSCWKRSHFLL